MLLNSPLAVESARAMAQRVQRDAGADSSQQMQHAFELALQRLPDEVESASCQRLRDQHSLAELCRVLINLNGFAYVD